jgi:hypothetical protein
VRSAHRLEFPGVPQRNFPQLNDLSGYCHVIPAIISKGLKFIRIGQETQENEQDNEESQEIQFLQRKAQSWPGEYFAIF